MGEKNQSLFLAKHLKGLEIPDGPLLEVGSHDYGSAQGFARFFDGRRYIGADITPGKGVDVVADIEASTGPFEKDRFAFVFCCSVLEHVKRPWKMAQNITEVTKPGGILYVSTPWVQQYHKYPEDYFRFSETGLKSLFDGFEWLVSETSTTINGEFLPFEEVSTEDNYLVITWVKNDKPRSFCQYRHVHLLGRKRA